MRKNNKGKKKIKAKIIYVIISALIGTSISTIYFKADTITGIFKNKTKNETPNKPDNPNEEKNIDDDRDGNDKEDTTNENPDGNNKNAPSDKPSSGENEKPKNIVYIVQSGDTLTKISRRYNVTVEQIMHLNGLTDDLIFVGQALSVPNHDTALDTSIVTKPDELLVLVNKKNYLSSDYVPNNLVIPNVPFPFEEYHTKKLMRKDAASALEELFNKAQQDNINLYAMSGYRSYETQKTIFNSNVKLYGYEQANQFSAVQGQSEHQTGLAMDVTSPSVNYSLVQSFAETKEGKWLKENIAEFGFIIRFPKGKEHITGYQYEPWHIRYVGKEVAKEITDQNMTLEEYLNKE